MLILDLPNAPRWHDPAPGVRVHLRLLPPAAIRMSELSQGRYGFGLRAILSNPTGALQSNRQSWHSPVLRRVHVTHDQVEAMTPASTIVIMRDGEIHQVGAPMEIYDRPANMFVAGFIGAPPMNFIDAVHMGGGGFAVEGREDAIALPSCPDCAEGAPAALGIRPEEFGIDRGDAPPPGGLAFDVFAELIEPMGADTVVTFTIGSRELQARIGGRENLEVGEPLRLSCAAEAVRGFDRETEAAISG